MDAPKTILVATDFREAAAAALDYAVRLGQKLGATVFLVHTYELPVVGLPDGVIVLTAEMASHMISAAEAALKKEIEPYAARGIVVRTILEQGDPREGVLAAAKKSGADLIVLGTHGRRGLARALLGSVAEAVVRTAPVPVLTVHADEAKRTER